MDIDTPFEPDATLAEIYSEAFVGVQAMIDATIDFLAYAQGAEFKIGSLIWHEFEHEGDMVCQLSQAETLLMQWKLRPSEMSSECRWKHLQTIH